MCNTFSIDQVHWFFLVGFHESQYNLSLRVFCIFFVVRYAQTLLFIFFRVLIHKLQKWFRFSHRSSVDLIKSVSNEGAKFELESSNNFNNWVIILFKLLPNLQINLPCHALKLPNRVDFLLNHRTGKSFTSHVPLVFH